MQAVEPSKRIEEIMDGLPVAGWAAADGALTALARRGGSDWSWRPIHPGRLTAPDRSFSAAAARLCGLGPGPAALVRWRGESFFICQPHLAEHDVDSLHRTL